jgi:hypothetical protein
VIQSIFIRIAGYFVLLGFVVYLISPSWNWLRGRGFIVDDSYWIELTIVSILVVRREVARFRRVTRSRFC